MYGTVGSQKALLPLLFMLLEEATEEILLFRPLNDAFLSLCQMCRLLLEHGCAVNYLSKTGESALHILTKKDRFEAAMVLLTHGANANLKGQDGNTALHLAMKVIVQSRLPCSYLPGKKQ